MKYRFDFVTNSSSSSFVVRVGVRLKDGKELKYEAFSEDNGGGSDVGDIIVDRDLLDKAAEVETLNELITVLENAVTYSLLEDLDEPPYEQQVSKVFDPKDFELYKGIRKKAYTRDDYWRAEFECDETDNLDDGRSVPFSKGIVIFDKAIRKKAKDLDEIESVIVESELLASGENIDGYYFSDLDRSESRNFAKYISVREMDMGTHEISETTSAEWCK